MFKLEDQSKGGTNIDLNTGPYHAAVISSHGCPVRNDAVLGQSNYIRNTGINFGVYIKYALITNTPPNDQHVKVEDGEGRQFFKTLLTPFSLKRQENSFIPISSGYWAPAKAQPVFLLWYHHYCHFD